MICLAQERAYTLGIVPQFEARKIHAIWDPIVAHIEAETGLKLDISGSPTIPAFEKEFIGGSFDFAYMNPYHLVIANTQEGYRPLLRDVSRTLYGVLVVTKDSQISSVEDLDGTTIAFPAPNALGASLQMRQELSEVFGISFTPSYVKSHDSVYLNVLLGSASAGGGVQKTFDRQDKNIRDNLRILHKTKAVAPHPIAVHPRVPDEVRQKFTNAMLQLSQSAQGKSLFAKIPIKELGEATLEDYQELTTMNLDKYYVR